MTATEIEAKGSAKPAKSPSAGEEVRGLEQLGARSAPAAAAAAKSPADRA